MSKCRHQKGNARFGKGAATGRTGRDGTKKKKQVDIDHATFV